MAIQVNDANFEKEVLKSEIPVVIDFWAAWCGPCRALTPIIEELSNEYKDKIKVVKVNVDDASETSQKYSVSGIPTLVFMKNGKETLRIVGLKQKKDLVRSFNELLD